MRFACHKETLVGAFETVAKVCPASAVTHSDLNVQMEVRDGTLRLATENHQLSASTSMPVDEGENGSVAIVGRLGMDILRGVLTSRQDRVEVSTQGLRAVVTSADARYDVSGYEVFGSVVTSVTDPLKRFDVPTALLTEALRQVLPVAGGESTTYAEVHLDCVAGELSIVATDSVRLAMWARKVEGVEIPDFTALVPSHSLAELLPMLRGQATVGVSLSEEHVGFTLGPTEIRARLSDKTFPNFRTILPKTQATSASIRTQELIDNLKGVLPLAKDTKNKVFFDFRDDRIVVSSMSPEFGEARREVECVLDGPGRLLAFNAKYVLDFLATCGTPNFTWGFTKETYPSTMRPSGDSGFVTILMPLTHV